MVFEFGSYRTEIDVDKTKQFYETTSLVSESCSCSGCRNYERAVSSLPSSVIDFFTSLGVDMRRVCEIYVNCVNPNGTLLYGGFYHPCGTVLSGESAWISNGSTSSHWEENQAFIITDSFRVSFQQECDLLEKDFPAPALQLEISASIPWVLSEGNTWM